MTELELFYMFIQIWIGLMLTIQSIILYLLLPEIKKMSFNTERLGSMFGLGEKKKNNN